MAERAQEISSGACVAGGRTSAHRDSAIVVRIVGDDLGRGGVSRVGAGLTRGGAVGRAEANPLSSMIKIT